MITAPRTTAMFARVRSALHDELTPLGRPSALSWRVAAVYLPLAVVSQWVSDASYTDTSLREWAIPTLASVAVFIAMFGALHLLANHRSMGPGMVLLAFAIAGTARAVSICAVAVTIGVSDSMEWTFRLAGGLLLSPALLSVIAIAVSRHDAHLAIVTELQGQRDRLLDVGESTDKALARTEDEITMATRAAIQPALDALDSVLDSVATDASAQPAVQALVRLVDDEVRPVSHRLATQDHWVSPSIDRARHPGRVRVPLPASVAVVDGIRPVIAAALFFSVSAPTVLRFTAFGVALVQLAAGALFSWFVLIVATLLLRSVRLSAVGTVLTVAGAHVIGALIVVRTMQSSLLPISTGGHAAGLVLAAAVGTATSIGVVVDMRRAATHAELVRVVTELETVIEMMGRRARLASTRLAHVVHGSLQGALHAAAIRLAEAQRPDAALVQTIRDDITAALERLDDRTTGGAALRDTLDELVTIWSGHRDVRVAVGPDVVAALAADRDADAAAAEVVREAVNNALRHGRARSVDIDVRLADTGEPSLGHHRSGLRIMVTDDGSGWDSHAPRGLGSILFDDLCTSWHRDTWHRDSPGSGTRVVAVVGVLSEEQRAIT